MSPSRATSAFIVSDNFQFHHWGDKELWSLSPVQSELWAYVLIRASLSVHVIYIHTCWWKWLHASHKQCLVSILLCIIWKSMWYATRHLQVFKYMCSNRNNWVDINTFYNHCLCQLHLTPSFQPHLCYIIIIHLITLCILSAFFNVFSHSTSLQYIHTYVLQRQDWQISNHWISNLHTYQPPTPLLVLQWGWGPKVLFSPEW